MDAQSGIDDPEMTAKEIIRWHNSDEGKAAVAAGIQQAEREYEESMKARHYSVELMNLRMDI